MARSHQLDKKLVGQPSQSETDSDYDSSNETPYETDLTYISSDDDDNATTNELALDEQDHPPEYYLTCAKTIDTSELVGEDYAPSSTEQLDRIDTLWRQYCAYTNRDSQSTFSNLSIGDLYSFFTWMLNQRRGKDGRRLRGTKIASSLSTYWKQFRLVFERATSEKIDPKVNRQMHRVLRKVAKENGLSNEKREKPPMDVEDVTEFLQTNLTTTEKRYCHGRHRIQLAFWVHNGFITANRPQAILNLCYRHVVVTLLRDPKGGPHRALLEFTYEFTKTYLGMKEANTFPMPEIIFDPSLILSPYVFLMGLLFADKAFLAPGLTCPEQISKLDIPPGCNSLSLPLKPELDDIPVFRRSVRTVTGWEISPNLPLQRTTVSTWMKSLGEITGFRQVARPYCLRYGAGKAFDESGNVSDALRNLMMQHADTRTFLKYYLSRRITADTQAIVRGLAPQDDLIRAACRMSRWIDRRRPWKLTAEQSLSVNEDPRICRLLECRAKLKGRPSRWKQYERLGQEITNERQRLRYALRQSIRKGWDTEQALIDIERQLSGGGFEKELKMQLESSVELTPEHKRLIETIMSLPGSTIEEEIDRRNSAINAIAAYCTVEEGGNYRPRRQINPAKIPLRPKSPKENKSSQDTESALQKAIVSVYQERRPKVCFLCLGNEKLPLEKRMYAYSAPGDLSKHFRRKHLKHIVGDEEIECKLCSEVLTGKMHLQNHACRIHGTVS
ncbi:MAG: hypothetical protein M1814_005325 [Vezdaea aestivalis]|nr:MAG: hypothetical protein M1814_005325 [Vezdaea aestivalis]